LQKYSGIDNLDISNYHLTKTIDIMAEPFRAIGTFGIRNDKYRGLLVETFESQNGNVYFFKYQHQPIHIHCEQMQNIVRAANITRAKKIKVDITSFLHEYYRKEDDTFYFKANKLNSANDQVQKVQHMRINKEIGIAKRKNTIADNKQSKIVEKNTKLLAKLAEDEKNFQKERIERINVMMKERLNQQRGVPSDSMDS
jgi:hypothetical protein